MKRINDSEMIPFVKNPYLRLFDDPFFNFGDTKRHMLTTFKELDDKYVYEVEAPGFKREEISIELKDGNIIIEASHNEEKEEKDGEKVIFSERKSGAMKRVFQVPKETSEGDIHASLNNGILTIEITKKEPKEEERKMIQIG